MPMKKKEMNRVIIGLGSNHDGEKNIAAAIELLRERFPLIRISSPKYTEPEGMDGSELFLNCMAVVLTPEAPDALTAIFKQMEKTLGRTLQGKQAGVVPIDIDLLRWNDLVLKPGDLERNARNGITITLPHQA